MNWYEFVSLAFSALIPITLYVVAKQNSDRAEAFGVLNKRLDHLDSCVDELKRDVLGSTVSRVDFESAILALRREWQEAINGQTQARHSQTSEFNAALLRGEERIMPRLDRLETWYITSVRGDR